MLSKFRVLIVILIMLISSNSFVYAKNNAAISGSGVWYFGEDCDNHEFHTIVLHNKVIVKGPETEGYLVLNITEKTIHDAEMIISLENGQQFVFSPDGLVTKSMTDTEDTPSAIRKVLNCPGKANPLYVLFESNLLKFDDFLFSILKPGSEINFLSGVNAILEYMDITHDELISAAEHNRFIRHFVTWATVQEAEHMEPVKIEKIYTACLGTMALAPLITKTIFLNHDYDNDGFLSKSEILSSFSDCSEYTLTTDTIINQLNFSKEIDDLSSIDFFNFINLFKSLF